MNFMKGAMLGVVAALGLALPNVAAEQAIIVLDGSGSMWAQIDSKARITIARETLSSVLSSVPGDLELGLMTYGHRERGNCGDIELLVEPAAGTAGAIAAAANKINPKGMTPLSDAVRLAAEELRFTEEKATVILITDGLETCEVDPCALGNELAAQGIDFTAHVLGFGLSDDEGRQVACLAENTGGKYLSAQDGASLVEALTTTVAEVAQAEPEPAPEPEPVALDYNILPTASLAEGGELLNTNSELAWRIHAVGPAGDAGDWIASEYGSGAKISVEPGKYIMRAEFGHVKIDQPITVVEGELLEPHFVLNAGIVKVRAYAAEGENPHRDAQIMMNYAGGGSTSGWGEETFRIPAGQQTMTITLGGGTYEETFTLAAGEVLEKDIIVGTGVAKVDAIYVEGMDVTDNGMYVRIFKAKKAIDGSREQVSYEFGPGKLHNLPAGDYVAQVELDAAVAEVPFTVAVGESVEVVVPLNAGVAAFTTPALDIARVYGAKVGIDGSRTEFAYEFAAEWHKTFPAGDYVLLAKFKDGEEKEVPFSVTAGERTEVSVEPGGSKSK